MTSCIVAFAVAFCVAVACTPLVRTLARRWGVVDRPDGFRKTDCRNTPLLGGAAVYVAFLAPVAALILLHRNDVSELLLARPGQLAALLGGGAVALGLGVLDDALSLPARWKLLLQTLAAAVALAGGFGIKAISNPFGAPIVLGAWSVPLTLFWFIGCMNAVNLLDGLDGLAAGVALFVTVTLLLVSAFFGNVLAMVLLACLSGALLGFLLYNFHPASIFLGDSGSMLLGYYLAALSLLSARKAETAVALLIPLIALGLPIFDTSVAILRRWTRKLPVSSADRRHIHHALMAMGLTHRRAVLVMYGACGALGGAALLISGGRSELTLIVTGSLAILAFVCVRVLGGVRLEEVLGRVSKDWTMSRRVSRARVAVEVAAQRIEDAGELDAAWAACQDAFAALELDAAELRLGCPADMTVWRWSRGDRAGRDDGLDTWSARLKVRGDGRPCGEMELTKWVETGLPLPAAPELAQRLCAEVTAACERLWAARPAAVEQPTTIILSEKQRESVGDAA